jgi:hypothetical protein
MKGFSILLLSLIGLLACQPETDESPDNKAPNAGSSKNLKETNKTDEEANNPFNQIALFIAGRESPQFKNIQGRDYYINYKAKLNDSWKQVTAQNLKNIKKWYTDNQIPVYDSLPLFYPFSGPDFLYAHTFFPNTKTQLFIGLENPGKLPNLAKMDDEQISAYLYKLYHSLRFINQNGYFTTSQMQDDFKDPSMNGVIHLLCFYLSKTGHRIAKISFVHIDNFGNEKEKKNFELETELVNGLKIIYFSDKFTETRTLYYFPFDLSDRNIKDHLGFIAFLSSFGPKNTFMKSASYLLHDKEFSLIQDLIVKQSDKIIQDDSGLPYAWLVHSGFSVQLFGKYTNTIPIFSKYFQPDLKRIVDEGKARDLQFKLGYNSLKNEMVLMYASKKRGEINRPITYKTEKEGVVFKVQIKSSWKKIPADAAIFKGLPKIDYYHTDNLYKYTIGNFSTPEACEDYRKLAVRYGFTDAFVVAFYQKNRISLEEAERIMKEG